MAITNKSKHVFFNRTLSMIISDTVIANLVEIITSQKAPDKMILVAVAGLSRSGKSMLIKNSSEILAQNFITTTTIELDHWIMPASKRNPEMTVRNRYQYNL